MSNIIKIARLIKALEDKSRTEESKAEIIKMHIGLNVITEEDALELATEYGNMKTILWEPMTDGIYGTFDSLADARAKYNVTKNDYFEIRDGILWVALNDD